MNNQKPTIGLITPPASGEVPSDGSVLYGDRVRFIASGLGIGGVSPRGFAPVMNSIVDCARQLQAAGAQAISLMGTSISFHKGRAFADALRSAMREATGVPCTTMSHAIVEALAKLQVKRVAVATAYIDELNQKLTTYLTESGIGVTAIEGLSLEAVKQIGEVATETLVGLSRKALMRDRSAEGILISCGGLLTLDAIRELEGQFGLPVVASSPAGFWDVMREAGVDSRSAGQGRLFALR